MKLEKLNYGKEKVHKILLYGLISVVVLLLTVTLITSKANYKISSSVQLAKGKISYKAPELNVIGMYVNDGNGNYIELPKDEFIPENSYAINEEKSYCYKETSSVHDENIKLYTNDYGEHVMSKISKNDKCYLYFDKKIICNGNNACNSIKENINQILERKTGTFSQTITGNNAPTEKTLYVAKEEIGYTYYYAGNPIDNWVKFGKEKNTDKDIWWRIIRINENGSIRMIYAGTGTTSPSTTGEGTKIETSVFNANNDDNKYMGYFYEQDNVHGTKESSTIYSSINNFYNNNIKETSYESYIDKDAGFCNDRTIYSNFSEETPTDQTGKGTENTFYGAFIRLRTNNEAQPTYSCNNTNDLFTAKTSTIGNKKLENSIGLITADEATFAGITKGEWNDEVKSDNFLYTGQSYWTMSPSDYTNAYKAVMIVINYNGSINGLGVNSKHGVRPVINLRSDVKLTGNGTSSNPYEVVE